MHFSTLKRVCSPFTQSYRNTPLSQCFKMNEQEKKRAYDQRIREVEHRSFSPSLFHIRRNGTYSQCGLQKNSLNDSSETQQNIQQDSPLDQIDVNWATHCYAQKLCIWEEQDPATTSLYCALTKWTYIACHEGQVYLQWTQSLLHSKTPQITSHSVFLYYY